LRLSALLAGFGIGFFIFEQFSSLIVAFFHFILLVLLVRLKQDFFQD